jgi:dTDP-4-dehydrorhamnose 3,5-epimerase-like enzyme
VDEARPRLVDLTSIPHESGEITVVEHGTESPFAFERVYFLHGLRPDSERGSHAHVKLRQLMIAVNGSFEVKLTGLNWDESFFLDSPNRALFVPPMTWRDLSGFSEGAVCLVLASEIYDEADYIRDYQDFLALRAASPGDFYVIPEMKPKG